MGGTNDSLKGDFHCIYKSLESTLVEICKEKPVILTTIPRRFDKKATDPVHDEIDLLNAYIRELVIRTKSSYLIDLDQLRRYHYSRHGLHLNMKGRVKLSYLILQSIKQMVLSDKLPTTFVGRGTNALVSQKEASKTLNVDDELNQKQPIRIIEADMTEIIQKFSKEEDTAFAHCISADVYDNKNMSAGVANVFRKHFGRPKPTDFCQNHLTCQKGVKESSIYGLVTKPVYHAKPSIYDYDLAFRQLTDDFKKKGLKRLICSPMGCVRDRISIQHFVDNLVTFQNSTEASVTIVTYEERVNRVLWDGYTYLDFINKLKYTVKSHFNSLPHSHNQTDQVELDSESTTREPIDLSAVDSTNNSEASEPMTTLSLSDMVSPSLVTSTDLKTSLSTRPKEDNINRIQHTPHNLSCSDIGSPFIGFPTPASRANVTSIEANEEITSQKALN